MAPFVIGPFEMAPFVIGPFEMAPFVIAFFIECSIDADSE